MAIGRASGTCLTLLQEAPIISLRKCAINYWRKMTSHLEYIIVSWWTMDTAMINSGDNWE